MVGVVLAAVTVAAAGAVGVALEAEVAAAVAVEAAAAPAAVAAGARRCAPYPPRRRAVGRRWQTTMTRTSLLVSCGASHPARSAHNHLCMLWTFTRRRGYERNGCLWRCPSVAHQRSAQGRRCSRGSCLRARCILSSATRGVRRDFQRFAGGHSGSCHWSLRCGVVDGGGNEAQVRGPVVTRTGPPP
jgi:hypothetical protein